ncbi:MAG: CDP-alcohol phosphatidyltransferase family protein [Anaerolineales bacterium]|nr:CDP-alcohol phosphatidyltransferase family protein [Anaerolineales bacterium]
MSQRTAQPAARPAGAMTFTDRLRSVAWVLDPIIEGLHKLGVHPNQLTLAGVLGSWGAAVLVAQGHYLHAGLLVLLTGPLDALDGALARRRGEPQAFGAFVDSVTDRYAELAVFAGLLWVAQVQGDPLLSLATYFAAMGSVLVSYVRARAQSLGFEAKGGWFSRVERFLVLTLGLLLSQPLLTVIILGIGANLTALQRIWHVRRMAKAK